MHNESAWSVILHGDATASRLKTADPGLQETNAEPFEHQVICNQCDDPFA